MSATIKCTAALTVIRMDQLIAELRRRSTATSQISPETTRTSLPCACGGATAVAGCHDQPFPGAAKVADAGGYERDDGADAAHVGLMDRRRGGCEAWADEHTACA